MLGSEGLYTHAFMHAHLSVTSEGSCGYNRAYFNRHVFNEAPFKLTHTNNTEGQQNLLKYVGKVTNI